MLDELRGKDSIAEVSIERVFPKAFTTNGQKILWKLVKKLAGDTARAATTDEVKNLRREARHLKEVVAKQNLKLQILKKTCRGWERSRMRCPASEKIEIINGCFVKG